MMWFFGTCCRVQSRHVGRGRIMRERVEFCNQLITYVHMIFILKREYHKSLKEIRKRKKGSLICIRFLNFTANENSKAVVYQK